LPTRPTFVDPIQAYRWVDWPHLMGLPRSHHDIIRGAFLAEGPDQLVNRSWPG
jgi:hypothetical protein